MALEQFKPTLWAAAAQEPLRKALVLGAVANRDYQGEISGYGSTVKILSIGPTTVATYDPDSTTVSYGALNDAQRQLKIDQSYYLAFKVDDVDEAQAKPKVMQLAMRDGIYQLSDQVDQYLAGRYVDAGIVDGLGTEAVPIDVTSVNVTEYLGLVKQKLSEANVPNAMRWFAGAPWFIQKVVLARITLDTSNSGIISEGFVGRYLGMDLYESNNISVGTPATNAKTRNMAGYDGTMTLAMQLDVRNMEAIRLESKIATGVRCPLLFGAKVTRPDALACLRADYTTEP